MQELGTSLQTAGHKAKTERHTQELRAAGSAFSGDARAKNCKSLILLIREAKKKAFFFKISMKAMCMYIYIYTKKQLNLVF